MTITTYRLESPNNPSAKECLSLVIVEWFPVFILIGNQLPIFFDVIVEIEHVLFQLAKYHERAIFRERRALDTTAIVLDRIALVAHYDDTWWNDSLTWMRVTESAIGEKEGKIEVE